MNHTAFFLSSALSRVAETIETGAVPSGAEDGEPAYALARGLRAEAHSDLDISPEAFVDLLAGMSFSGLEDIGVQYQGQEVLAAIALLTDADPGDVPAPVSPISRQIYPSMDESARDRALTLFSAGMVVTTASRTGVSPSDRVAQYRQMISEGLVPEIDWTTDDPALRAEED